jgi:hypothetical protein
MIGEYAVNILRFFQKPGLLGISFGLFEQKGERSVSDT